MSRTALDETTRQRVFAVQDVIDTASVLRGWISQAHEALRWLDGRGRSGLPSANETLKYGAQHLQRASKDARLAGRRGVALEWLRALSSVQQEAREMYSALEAAVRLVRDKEEA